MEMASEVTVAERARRARQAAGLRQIDAAIRGKVCVATVAMAERGSGFLTRATAERLARVYKVRASDLLGRGR